LAHEVLFPCCRSHGFRSRIGIYDLIHWKPCGRHWAR
jgi:hypothetical protein